MQSRNAIFLCDKKKWYDSWLPGKRYVYESMVPKFVECYVCGQSAHVKGHNYQKTCKIHLKTSKHINAKKQFSRILHVVFLSQRTNSLILTL